MRVLLSYSSIWEKLSITLSDFEYKIGLTNIFLLIPSSKSVYQYLEIMYATISINI